MKIYLHIERLVLDGVAVEQPRVLRRALEKELSRRLMDGGLSPEFRTGGAVARVHGGSIELGKGSNPAKLGTQIAGAVYRGIGASK
jgi:hypothetical protein